MGRPQTPIEHGTYSGYQKHNKRGIPINGCGCDTALAAYMREFRKDPKARRRNLDSQLARKGALAELGRRYRAEYQQLYAQELGRIRGAAKTRAYKAES